MRPSTSNVALASTSRLPASWRHGQRNPQPLLTERNDCGSVHILWRVPCTHPELDLRASARGRSRGACGLPSSEGV